jgi:hypothetical protein
VSASNSPVTSRSPSSSNPSARRLPAASHVDALQAAREGSIRGHRAEHEHGGTLVDLEQRSAAAHLLLGDRG